MNLAHRAGLPLGQHPPLAGHVHSLFSRAQAWLASLPAALAERRVRAEEMAFLRSFTDRDLHDIGLTRADLPSVEKGLYSRE